MHNKEDDYIKLTQYANINSYYNRNKFNTKFMIVYLLFFTTLSLGIYLGFEYGKGEKQHTYKTKVMGVSDVYHVNNAELGYKYKMEFNDENESEDYSPTLKEDSLYTEVLAQ